MQSAALGRTTTFLAMATVNQQTFEGGMNYLTVMTKLSAGEYPIAQNIRVRYGGAQGIKVPADYTSKFLAGKVQGIYGANEKLVVIISGNAYYMDCLSNTVQQSLGFSMSPDVQDIYGELVPASGARYRRVPATPNKANTSVSLTDPVSGTPAAGIFFDGVTRPTLILSDGTSRPVGDYNSWTPDNPEYVPQGLIPLYVNGILYLACYDKPGGTQLNVLARSVTNDPLNFMVNVTPAGDKLPTEPEGGYLTTAVPFNYGEITALARITSIDGTFYAGTAKSSVLVQPDFTELIYGEPQFNMIPQFDAGAVNANSVVGILGDTALIDQTGLVSFNAVQQLKWQGNNAPFSKSVYKLFEGIQQTRTAAVAFDNYALFAITTIFGPAVLVYDMLLGVYVSLDIHPNVAQICQFAIIKTNNLYRLFARTVENQIFELFAGATYATARIYIGDHSDQNPRTSQRVNSVNAVFMGSDSDGVAEARLYVDKVEVATRTARLNAHNYGIKPPFPIPYQAQKRDTDPTVFNFTGVESGWKIGAMLSWSTGAQLTNVELDFTEFRTQTNVVKFGEIPDKSYSGGTQRFCIMPGWTVFPPSAHIAEMLELMRAHNYEYLLSTGGMNLSGTLLGLEGSIITPCAPELREPRHFYSALSTYDLDVLNGRHFVDNLRQPNNGRYFTVDLVGVLCHFINPGYTTAAAVLDGSGNPVGPSLEPDGVDINSVQAGYFRRTSATGRLNLQFSNLPLYSNVINEYKILRWNNPNINIHFSSAPSYERIVNTSGTYVNLAGDMYVIADVGPYQINFKVYKYDQTEIVDAFVAQL